MRYAKVQIEPQLYERLKQEIIEYRTERKVTCVCVEKNVDYLTLPSLREYLDHLGITEYVINANYICVMPGDDVEPHVDEPDRFIWSLTIPFVNAAGTYNRFYRSDQPIVRHVRFDKRDKWAVQSCLQYADMSDARLIDMVEVDGPMLLNTAEMHDVHNTTNMPREALGVRLNKKFHPSLLTSFQR